MNHAFSAYGRLSSRSHFELQLEVASTLAPAEAVLGHCALVVSCGNAAGSTGIEAILRERLSVDEVEVLHCPIKTWSDALREVPGASSWFRHYIVREINRRAPSVVVLHDAGGAAQREDLLGAAALLRQLGITVPISALRTGAQDEFDWLSSPERVYERAG